MSADYTNTRRKVSGRCRASELQWINKITMNKMKVDMRGQSTTSQTLADLKSKFEKKKNCDRAMLIAVTMAHQ